MKSLPLFLALSTFSGAAAAHDIDNNKVIFVRHIVSRNVENRDVSAFKKIRLEGIADLFLTQGTNQQVQVDAEEGVAEHITTTVENGTLIISSKGQLVDPGSIKVYVTVPRIEGVSTSGTGNVVGLTPITSNTLELASSGTGDITLSVGTTTLNSSISGTGNIDLTGSTRSSHITLEGTGNFHGRKLLSTDVTVNSSGTGDAEVSSKESLVVNLSGTGDVRYSGEVRNIQSLVSGTGAVRKLPKS